MKLLIRTVLTLTFLNCFFSVNAQISVGVYKTKKSFFRGKYQEIDTLSNNQINKIKRDSLYLILPGTEAGKKQEYETALKKYWTTSEVIVLERSEDTLIQKLQNFTLIEVEGEYDSYYVQDNKGKGGIIIRRYLWLVFKNYSEGVTSTNFFQFATINLIIEPTKDFYECTDTDCFDSYIKNKVTLRNYSPGLILLYLKIIEHEANSKTFAFTKTKCAEASELKKRYFILFRRNFNQSNQ